MAFSSLPCAAPADAATPAPAPPLSVLPGQLYPKEGLWFAPHLQMREIHMTLGQIVPGQTMGATGGVVWYFKTP